MTADADQGAYLTERRVVGLLVAGLVATLGYWFVARIEYLELLLFFLIFTAVFTGLNYALYRYD